MSSLPGLLQTQANIQKPLPRQKCANLLAALDSLYLLLAAPPLQSGTPPVSQNYILNLVLRLLGCVLLVLYHLLMCDGARHPGGRLAAGMIS